MGSVILVTGATGFLGCHIAQMLCDNNYHVVATKRSSSSLQNCSEFQEKVSWINTDGDHWKEEIVAMQPAFIIHAAWIGVTAAERYSWEKQSENIVLLQELLDIASRSGTYKFIGLGSQAEYGFIDTVVAETHSLKPINAYGTVKITCSQLLKKNCIEHAIEWYWCRVFSIFGEKEGTTWLLPSVIQTILAGEQRQMAFSPGDQQYAYLYIKDFVKAIHQIVVHQHDSSGIYNISSATPMPLKSILTFVRDRIDPTFELLFGSLPYRPNQPMLIAGDTKHFKATFGDFEFTSFEEGLSNTINFYQKN